MGMMTGTRGFKCVVAAALAVMVCLPLGGCSIEIKGGKRNNANTGNALDLKDSKWHTGSNGYGGSDSSSYRYVIVDTPDGEKHCIAFRDSGGAGGMSCWDKSDAGRSDGK